MAAAGSMAVEPIADPRLHHDAEDEMQQKPEIMERTWGLEARVDPTVTFEEFAYWAKIERADEIENNRQYVEKRGPLTAAKVFKQRFSKGVHHEKKKEGEKAERDNNGGLTTHHDMEVTDEEWKTAARALRTASWGTVFFLITTDILGWGSCP